MAKSATALKPVEDTAPRRIFIAEKDVSPKEFSSRDMRASIPVEHTLKDLMTPEYWLHSARRMPKDTIIWCFHKRGDFFALLWVYDRTDQYCRCRLIQHEDFTESEDVAPDPENYEIRHVENTGWSVIFKPTKALLVTGLASQEMAIRFVDDLMKKK